MLALHAALALVALSAPAPAANQTVLLDFYADWCAPCRTMDPTVRELAAKGYPVRRVNIDQDRALAAQFGVQSIPCFVMVANGKEVDRVVGGTNLARLERMCKLGASAATAGAMAGGRSAPAAGAASRTGPSPRGATPAAVASSGQAPVRPVSWNPSAGAPMDFDSALAAATVRIRIEDADGHSCGTGTIIDSRQGDALILTCGHVFRDSKGQGKIEVNLFGPTPATRVPARLITYDLKRDIGLITIRAPGPIAVARVAPLDYVLQPGQTVASVGCNNGDAPTVQHSRITNLNRFLGPPNIQVAGQPVVGRSGGGLFSADGRVIGVCNAADPSDREGLFAGLASIQAALDDTKLTYVYKPDARAPLRVAAASADPFTSRQAAEPAPRAGLPSPADAAPAAAAADVAQAPARLSSGEEAAINELHRRIKEGAQVICVIRNCHDPEGKTEVLMLDKVSAEFLKQLAAKAQPQDGRYYTSLEVPRTRKPILEWDAGKGYLHREPMPGTPGR